MFENVSAVAPMLRAPLMASLLIVFSTSDRVRDPVMRTVFTMSFSGFTRTEAVRPIKLRTTVQVRLLYCVDTKVLTLINTPPYPSNRF